MNNMNARILSTTLIAILIFCNCCSSEQAKVQVQKFEQYDVFISPKIDTNNVRNKAILELWQEYRLKRFENSFKGQTHDLKQYWAKSELAYKSFDLYRERLNNLDYFYVYTPSYALQIDSLDINLFSLQIMTMRSDLYFDATLQDHYPSALFSVKIVRDTTGYKLANAFTFNKAKKQIYQTSAIRYYNDKDYPFDKTAVLQAHQKLLDFSKKYQLAFLKDPFLNEPLIEFFVYQSRSQMQKDFGFDLHPFSYPSDVVLDIGGTQIGANKMAFYYGGTKPEANIHEVIHILLRQITPKPTMIEEGVCTYYGGSMGKSYEELKAGLIRYLTEQSNADFSTTSVFEMYDLNYNHTYTVMAVLVEYIEKKWGVERVLEMLKFEANEKGNDEEVFRSTLKTFFEIEESEFVDFLKEILNMNSK